MHPATGKAYLIGAGPGDPGLLTLRGRQRLGEADLVLYDYLVNPRILDWARPGAELVCLGSHREGRLITQEEIHERMIAATRAGKTVARLKGGDPAIFGRTAEETAALEAAGVLYEIVPGVTSAQAASSYAGVPLTHREAASCVAFVTGQQSKDNEGPGLDMAGLARFPGTLVFYMGVTSAPQWSAALIAHGRPGETPVAIVRHASLPQQETLRTTLADLPQVLAPGAMRPPAIIIVGEAAAHRPATDWFAARPLFGRTVLVTRPAHQSESLVEQLAELGAHVLVQPAIEIGPPLDWSAADAAVSRLSSFNWLVFSSANGVHYFLERLAHTGRDLRALGGVRIAAIGPGTADALSQYHLRSDLQPDQFRAEALADALGPLAAGTRVLLLRASRGREVLAERLTAAGVEVEQAVVYQSRDIAAADPEIQSALRDGGIDWVTVTSSAIGRSLALLFGENLHRTRLAAISPLTAEVLSEAGYAPAAVASQFTTPGLVQAILDAERGISGGTP
jgi:uroporphyrinogen III methyltransferase/synthase